MKKLNLNLKGIGEMLTKEQMRSVVGGDYGNDPCKSECASDVDCARYPSTPHCKETGVYGSSCRVKLCLD